MQELGYEPGQDEAQNQKEYPVEKPFELITGGPDQLMHHLVEITRDAENPVHFIFQGETFVIDRNGLVGDKDSTPDADTAGRIKILQEAADLVFNK